MNKNCEDESLRIARRVFNYGVTLLSDLMRDPYYSHGMKSGRGLSGALVSAMLISCEWKKRMAEAGIECEVDIWISDDNITFEVEICRQLSTFDFDINMSVGIWKDEKN